MKKVKKKRSLKGKSLLENRIEETLPIDFLDKKALFSSRNILLFLIFSLLLCRPFVVFEFFVTISLLFC